MKRRLALLPALGLLLGAAEPCPLGRPATPAWRDSATAADRERIGHWRDHWRDALATGPAPAGDALFDPDAALPDPALADGAYLCRWFHIGMQDANGSGGAQPVPCSVATDAGVVRFRVDAGSQRPAGRFFVDAPASRLIFLGTTVLGDERGRIGYGVDCQRDLGGVVERIGARRWRLALPRPAWRSGIDLIEITPR